MRSRPNSSKLHAGLSKPSGDHGLLPAAPAPSYAHSHHTAGFLEFAQAAGGFGVFDLNLVTGDITGTALFFELIGLPSHRFALTREEWVATIHPEDLETVVLALGAAIDSGTKYQAEYRTLLLNGEVRWLAGRAQVLKDAEGRPDRAVGTFERHHRAQAAGREAALRHRVAEHRPDRRGPRDLRFQLRPQHPHLLR